MLEAPSPAQCSVGDAKDEVVNHASPLGVGLKLIMNSFPSNASCLSLNN